LANTRFQTVYNYIGLGLNFEIWEMEFGEMKRNTSNWSNFCMLFLRRAGLTASAGLSCLFLYLIHSNLATTTH